MKKIIYLCSILSINSLILIASAGSGAVSREIENLLDDTHDVVDIRLHRLSSHAIPMLKEYALPDFYNPKKTKQSDPRGFGLVKKIKRGISEINLEMKTLILTQGDIANQKESCIENIKKLYVLLFNQHQDTDYMKIHDNLKDSDSNDIVEILASVVIMWDLYAACFGNEIFELFSQRLTPKEWERRTMQSGFTKENEFAQEIVNYYKEIEYKHTSIMQKYISPLLLLAGKVNLPTLTTMFLPEEEQNYLAVRSHLYDEQYSPDWGSLYQNSVYLIRNSSFGQWVSDKYSAIRNAWYSPANSSVATQTELDGANRTMNNTVSYSGGEIANLDYEMGRDQE